MPVLWAYPPTCRGHAGPESQTSAWLEACTLQFGALFCGEEAVAAHPHPAGGHVDIESLQPRIHRVAGRLAQDYQAETPDEWAQIMNLAILEHAETDRGFMLQTTAYIVSYAIWRARDWHRATFSARKLGLNNVAESLDVLTPDGIDLAETLADDEPDQDLAIDVKTAIGTLTGRARTVGELLLAGWQRNEIARLFGIRSQSLAGNLARVRVALAPICASL